MKLHHRLKKISITSLGEAVNFCFLPKHELEMIRRWRNHPSIRRWMYQQHIISQKEHLNFVRRLRKDTKNLMWLVRKNLPVIKRKSSEYIGVIAINRLDISNRRAYLGIYANPVTPIPGAGNILMTFLKKIAFNHLKLHTLKLEVKVTNKRAISFYRKQGFRKEGELIDYIRDTDGKYVNAIVMGLKTQ